MGGEFKKQVLGRRGKSPQDSFALLKQSTCTTDDLHKYLSKIDNKAAEVFARTGEWPSDVQIPKSPDVTNADGSINWDKAPKGGYVLNSNGDAIRTKDYPLIGETFDRFGSSDGRYTSPIIDGKSVDYDQRALPFIEDRSQYHRYQVTGDFSKLHDYVESCPDADLKSRIVGAIDYYYNGDYSEVIPYRGFIAGIDGWGSGGGLQEEFPIRIAWLERLGLLKEVFN